MKYRCSKCKKFLGEIKRLNLMTFTRSNRLEINKDSLIVTCKCGHIHEIDLKQFYKK